MGSLRTAGRFFKVGMGPAARCSDRRWVLALAVFLLAATPLAWATPPDQTWIEGIYDGADHDEVVSRVTNTSQIDERVRTASFEPLSTAARFLSPCSCSVTRTRSALAFRLRSPPRA